MRLRNGIKWVLVVAIFTTTSLSLQGCSNLGKLFRSDVTSEELRSLLLSANDFSGFEEENVELPDELISRLETENVCDLESTEIGPYLIKKSIDEEAGIVIIYSSSEPVCGGASAAKEETLKDNTLETNHEKALNYSIVSQGGGVKNYQSQLIDSSVFGENTISIAVTADLSFDETEVSYSSIITTVFNDKAAVSVAVEAYDKEFPEELLSRAVTIAKDRLSLI